MTVSTWHRNAALRKFGSGERRMTDQYSIQIDGSRSLLRIAIEGFWDELTFARFARDVGEAERKLPDHAGGPAIIVDASRSTVQSKEFADVLLARIRERRFRFAFVSGNALVRLQARRLLSGSGAVIVETVEQAEAALFPSV